MTERNNKKVKPLFSLKGKSITIGLIVSEWHQEITSKMLISAIHYLEDAGIKKSSLIIKKTPGSFEIPLAAQWLIDKHKPQAVICLGCIIKGETLHYKYICSSVTQAIMDLGLKYQLPVIFGVLTTHNLKQAKERSGGKKGDKGAEAAATAIKMLILMNGKRI